MFYKTMIFLATLFALFAASAHAAGDPRQCSYSADRARCGADNAFLAVRRYLSAVNHMPSSLSWGSGTHTCAASGRMLVWRCTWTQGNGANPTGAATVTFRALSNGWHIRVQVGT